jgi:hypothetical protein
MSNGGYKFVGSEFVLVEETRTIDEILASLIGNPGELQNIEIADITPDATLLPGDFEVPEDDQALDDIMCGRPGFYPAPHCTDFGYDVPLRGWTLHGVAISDEQAIRIFAEKMCESQEEVAG